MPSALIVRWVRLWIWGLLLVAFGAVILLSLLVWHQGEMIDYDMWRTVGWASAGLLLLAFQFPRRRE